MKMTAHKNSFVTYSPSLEKSSFSWLCTGEEKDKTNGVSVHTCTCTYKMPQSAERTLFERPVGACIQGAGTVRDDK